MDAVDRAITAGETDVSSGSWPGTPEVVEEDAEAAFDLVADAAEGGVPALRARLDRL